MAQFTRLWGSKTFPYYSLSTLLGIGLGLLATSLAGLPAHAQSPSSTELETARSPEQDTRQTNELGNSELNNSELDNSDAAEERSSSGRTIQLGLLPFVPPPEEPAPQNTLGGGRRNSQCIDTSGLATPELATSTTTNPEIAALAPPPQIIGLTEREKPTVWVYQPIASVQRILLSVREEDSQQFHSQTTIEMPPNSQWVTLQLPEDAPPLEPETNYVWAAIALCGEAPNPNDPALSTRIRRVAPTSSATGDMPPLALAETYARQGQWYDAVDVFVQAQASDRTSSSDDNLSEENVVETWQALLDYAEFSEVPPPSLISGNE